jgi:ABC-2 type transport system permease protein
VKSAWRIVQRELFASFVSPFVYVAGAVYLLLAGWTFLYLVEVNVGSRESHETIFFAAVTFWMPLFAAAITMRLFAEEQRSGTIESLMTAPLSDVEAVAGKFLAGWLLALLAAAPNLLALRILTAHAGVEAVHDTGGFLGGCLLFALMAALCVAIGLLVSLQTRSQALAAICTFAAICLPPFFLGRLAARLAWLSEAARDVVNVGSHVTDFTRGVIDSRPLVLYVSATWLLLFAAVKALEFRRWR